MVTIVMTIMVTTMVTIMVTPIVVQSGHVDMPAKRELILPVLIKSFIPKTVKMTISRSGKFYLVIIGLLSSTMEEVWEKIK